MGRGSGVRTCAQPGLTHAAGAKHTPDSKYLGRKQMQNFSWIIINWLLSNRTVDMLGEIMYLKLISPVSFCFLNVAIRTFWMTCVACILFQIGLAQMRKATFLEPRDQFKLGLENRCPDLGSFSCLSLFLLPSLNLLGSAYILGPLLILTISPCKTTHSWVCMQPPLPLPLTLLIAANFIRWVTLIGGNRNPLLMVQDVFGTCVNLITCGSFRRAFKNICSIFI